MWVGILGHPYLKLGKYLTLRWTKKYAVVLGISLIIWGLSWGPPGLLVHKIAPLDKAEVGKDQRMVEARRMGLPFMYLKFRL